MAQIQIHTHFVWSRVFTEANVPVYAKDDISQWQLGNGFISLDDLLGECFNKGLPVFERSAILRIAHYIIVSRA